MGQYTSEVLGIVGAVIGGVWGGGNWQAGYAIGSAIGGVIEGPTTIAAPGLAEAPVQTSRDGIPIPMVWGLHQVHGNIIQKNPETQVTTTESQGKGGGVETENTRRYRTFAIGICRGPIYDITRIWENGRLVYDNRSTPAIPEAETAEYAEGIRVYYGTESQLPDPDLEAVWGASETPHYKGLAYIVWVNKDLTDYAGAIPQFSFEINGSRDATITSKPYPIEALDALQASATPTDSLLILRPLDAVQASATPLGGVLRTALDSYNYEVEGLDASATPLGGELRVALDSYNYEVEGLDASATPQGGELRVALIQHTYETEGLDATATPLGGSLYTP